jgi:hypothetical protein
MSKVDIKRLVEANSKRSTIYTPIIEAIVNSLQAIEALPAPESGEVEVIFYRDQVGLALAASDSNGDATPDVTSIDVIDNGVGFNDENTDSFDTLHSSQKIKDGGMGFGRTFYLQYFSTVGIESVFKLEDNDKAHIYRAFEFTRNDFVDNQVYANIDTSTVYTKLSLRNIVKKHQGKLDKKVDTVGRKILEHLLPYFITPGYTCPKIILRDDHDGSSVTLNDFLDTRDEIQLVGDKELMITSPLNSTDYSFSLKVFKVYYSTNTNNILLTANKRAVTKTAMHEFVPEFKHGMFDTLKDRDGNEIQKNFSVHAYVLGEYLDENVATERAGFEFSKEGESVDPLSQRTIEAKAAEAIAGLFDTDVTSRRNKKVRRVRAYIDDKAPWNKPFFNKLDMTKLPIDASEEQIELELQAIKLREDNKTRLQVQTLLETPTKDVQKIRELVEEISDRLPEAGKTDLAHYVVLRRAVIEVFGKVLEWDDNGKYSKEEAMHKLVFPLRADSDSLSYDDHNLWMLDERLSFHEYLASDKPLNPSENDDRPDLLVFDRPILVRSGDDVLSNPITVFEFKRPQRKEYKTNEDPIKQVARYVKKVRSGDFTINSGRSITVNDNTPAYGFIVCDLTPKIRQFCEDAQLTKSPDEKGYFGYHKNYQIYFEVISFDKMKTDAELRNKVLFRKLGIV